MHFRLLKTKKKNVIFVYVAFWKFLDSSYYIQISSVSSYTPDCLIMPPLSVRGEVCCFPHRKLIFRFGRRFIYKFFEIVKSEIYSVCLSVCTTNFKVKSNLCFYRKSSMLYVNGFVSTSSTKQI